jgi:hypothetical protein
VQPWRLTGEGPAGVGVFQRDGPGFAIEPALDQARHEAVARAEDVEDLDREAGAGFAIVKAVRDAPVKATAPIGPRLQTRVALLTARTARRAAMVSVVPPAMWNSSSVPTIRSKRCSWIAASP